MNTMRLLPAIISAACTVGWVFALNVQLPVGTGKTPRLGYFLSPQHGFWKNAAPANAHLDEQIAIKGLNDKVDVYLDDRLVPHVYAQNDEDAYYVQGFLHAKYRLWQMEFQTHVAAGRLSEILGEQRLPTDRFFRRLGMVYGAEKTMANIEKHPAIKATVAAYAKGVNAFIKSLRPEQIPFEYKLLNYQPEEWTPLKTFLLIMFMSYDLSGRGAITDLKMTNARDQLGYQDFELLFANLQDSLDPIVPKNTLFAKPAKQVQIPIAADSLYYKKITSDLNLAPIEPDKDNGSNNWVVAGSKTKSGKPILCNDTHLGLNLPSLYFEMQINTPSHNAYGVSFPGAPTIAIGFNDSIAWGVTNSGRDVIDYYDMQFKDSTMNEYYYNGNWELSTKRKEIFKIKGKPDLVEEVAYTHYGPVIYDRAYSNHSTEGKYLAVKWSAHNAGTGFQVFYLLNRAKNYDDYMASIETWQCPGQNFAFASISGDIAIKQQGAFIARWNRQGDFILPGKDSAYDWQGVIPSSENPWMKNPQRGFVSSANQQATDASYPYYLGAAHNFPLYRGILINQRLSNMSNITVAQMQNLQVDNYNLFAQYARPLLIKYIDQTHFNLDEKKYFESLTNWNLRNDPNETGITIFKAVWDSLESGVWDDELLQTSLQMPKPDAYVLVETLLRDSVFKFVDNINSNQHVETIQEVATLAFQKAAKAIKQLEENGRLSWANAKDTRVNHLLQLPGLSRLHLPIGGGEHIINATKEAHGPSWRMVIHMTDQIEAYGVYPGGQNGNPGSKYYDNFVDTWVAGKYYRLLFLKPEEAAKSNQMKGHILFTKS